jgi:acylpyruvate hydrolase
MKFYSFRVDGTDGIAAQDAGEPRGLKSTAPGYPGSLISLLGRGGEALKIAGRALLDRGEPVDLSKVTLLPPLLPSKILCIGLNYADHAAEAKLPMPEVPTVFTRFASTLTGAHDPIRLPRVSSQLDYECELAAIIGKRGRYIDKKDALDHVAGYAAFNDASIRDYQLRTTQWTIGKNFDGTGPFGPALVTADSLPPGGKGLAIETRLNGNVMQRSNTDQLIFDCASLIAFVSQAMTLEPGDLIVTGTPGGVGAVRKPPIFMKAGDVCEVEIEGVGVLRNRIVADT